MVTLRRLVPPALFMAIPSAFILPILLAGDMLWGADVVNLFHYSRIVISDSFRAGRLPVWDPHVMGGFPLLAGLQGAVFYPPNWACIFLSAGTFWTLSAGLHLALAGFFAERWLRRGLGVGEGAALVGGLVFMLSGFVIGHLHAGHVTYVWATPWLPALLWRLERRLAAPTLKRGVLLGAVLALLFLAGVPQFVFVAGLIVAVRLLLHVLSEREGRLDRAKAAARSLGWLVLGLLFCAPQLFPTLELIGQMQRSKAENQDFLWEYSVQLRELGDLLVPPDKTMPGFWERCGFMGAATLILVAAAFSARHGQRWLWGGVALAGILLSLGLHTPFYAVFTTVVPGASLFRGPGRYLMPATLALCALAALGFEALWTRGARVFRLCAALSGVLAVLQLLVFDRSLFVGVEASSLQRPASVDARLRDICGLEGRIVSGSRGTVRTMGMCDAVGLDHVGGYEPMMLRRFAELMNVARGEPLDAYVAILAGAAPHPVIDLLAARVWFPGGPKPPDFAPYPNAMPRSWVVNNAVVKEDRAERLRTIATERWDPRRTVILESYPQDAPPVPTEKPAGRSKILTRRPGYYEIEAENDADAYLVLSEAYYPGWTAVVDGRPADVLPADHLIQTIRLPAGKHVVRFQYHSRFLALGFAVAALVALVPVGLLVRRHRHQLALQRLTGAP